MDKKNKNSVFCYALLILAFIISIVVVLTGAFLKEKYSISINSVSPKRFKAPREVVNEIATERLKQAARDSVVDLYKHDPNVKEKINQKLDNFFDEINNLRIQKTPIYNPYGEESVQSGTELSAEGEKYNYDTLSIYLSEDKYKYLLECTSDEYKEFKENVYSITRDILDIGIKEEAIAKNILSVKDEFENLEWDNTEKSIGYEIVSSVIEPNLTVDEDATQKAKEEKASEVIPIVYFAGQNIVDEGDIVTPEIYAVLFNLGYTNRSLADNIIPVVGAVSVIFIMFCIMAMYIFYFNKEIISHRKELVLLFSIYTICILISRLMIDLPFQFIPIILFTMLISLLLEPRLAIIANILMTMVCGITFSADINFIFYFTLTGIFAAIFAKYTTERSKIFPVAIIVSIVNGVVIFAISFLVEKNISNDTINNAIYAVLDGLLTVILCIGSLPVWEAIFGIVTPIKMLDLTNPNNKLLRRLTMEAPGTYQHSLIVGNLAETAAYDIGANPTLARVGGYYHDIGKLEYPQYFAENQNGENPHDDLDPYTSAKIIIGHVSKGIEMANENKLPKKITDIVGEHHGKSMIKYFYHRAKKINPDDEIDENDFRYKFLIPQSKESAIVMLADTVEAAVRSMIPSGKSLAEVEAFVRLLIKDKLDDGQLLDSTLTIKDIDTIANSFMRVFKAMYHERIPYPNIPTKEKEKLSEVTAD